jgi:hypothetical protein
MDHKQWRNLRKIKIKQKIKRSEKGPSLLKPMARNVKEASKFETKS